MAIEHNIITDPDLHEPKGIASANSRNIYIADGAGSGIWQPIAMGSVWQDARSSPIVITGSGAGAVRVSDILTGGAAGNGLIEVQANSDSSLQYTGTLARHFHIAATLSAQRSSGASAECTASIQHYDDSAGTWSTIPHSYVVFEILATPTSTAMHADIMMSTNDKLAVAVHNTGGGSDVSLVTNYLFMMGMPGV